MVVDILLGPVLDKVWEEVGKAIEPVLDEVSKETVEDFKTVLDKLEEGAKKGIDFVLGEVSKDFGKVGGSGPVSDDVSEDVELGIENTR